MTNWLDQFPDDPDKEIEDVPGWIAALNKAVEGRDPAKGRVIVGRYAWERFTKRFGQHEVEYKGCKVEPRHMLNDWRVVWEEGPGIKETSQWRPWKETRVWDRNQKTT